MNYFLDTNIVIDLFKKKESTIKKITEIANNNNDYLFINRLVYTESLRTIKLKDKNIFKKSKETLDSFEKLDITQEIYDKTINFSRFCVTKGVTLKGKCAIIDYLHFITAKYYNLEIISNDNDFEKMEEKYKEYLEIVWKNKSNSIWYSLLTEL